MPTVTAYEKPKPLELWMQVKDRDLLKQIMEAKGISNRELSRRLGWEHHSYINRIVNGTVRSVSGDTALRIAYILEVPINLLFVAKASEKPGSNVRKGRAA